MVDANFLCLSETVDLLSSARLFIKVIALFVAILYTQDNNLLS
jgi:hypothetical protein